MAKSLRSKRKKRLRTLRREIVEPFYDKKDEAKLKAQEAALNAPKLPVRMPKSRDTDESSMDLVPTLASSGSMAVPALTSSNSMDVEMADGGNEQLKSFLKPVGGIGKRALKKKLKLKKDRRKGGKIRRKKNI